MLRASSTLADKQEDFHGKLYKQLLWSDYTMRFEEWY
jgi:hypothetical protein